MRLTPCGHLWVRESTQLWVRTYVSFLSVSESFAWNHVSFSACFAPGYFQSHAHVNEETEEARSGPLYCILLQSISHQQYTSLAFFQLLLWLLESCSHGHSEKASHPRFPVTSFLSGVVFLQSFVWVQTAPCHKHEARLLNDLYTLK